MFCSHFVIVKPILLTLINESVVVIFVSKYSSILILFTKYDPFCSNVTANSLDRLYNTRVFLQAIFMPAKFRLKKKTALKLCWKQWKLYEEERRRFSGASSHSRTSSFSSDSSHSSAPSSIYSRNCNDFCCYPALKTESS